MDIIEKLTAKTSLCNLSALKEWWGPGVSIDPLPAMVEWDEDGCFIIDTNMVTYCNFSIGRTHKLKSKINPSNWANQQQLYVIGRKSGLFRIDLPVKYTIVTIDNLEWEYTETVRPGTGNGEIIMKQYYTFESVKTEIEGMYELFKAAKEISSLIPLVKFSHLRHDSDGFYFYTDWGYWNFELEEVVNYNLYHIQSYASSRYNNIANEETSALLEYAETKWRSLL